MKKEFFDDLPRYEYGRYKNKINWKDSIGHKIKIVNDDEVFLFEIIDFNKETRKITVANENNERQTIRCNKNQIHSLTSNIHFGFHYKINEVIKDKNRCFKIIDCGYLKHEKAYKIKCLKCGFDSNELTYKNGQEIEYWIRESHIKRGVGCPCCKNRIVQPGINDIKTTDKWMLPYLLNKEDSTKYCAYSGEYTKMICPNCKNKHHKKYSFKYLKRNKGISCVCQNKKSFPERIMENILIELKIEYVYGYKINPYTKIFDFYIPNIDTIIEMDGWFHFHDNKMNGVKKEESIRNDLIKNEICKKNNIRLIRINCEKSDFEYIKKHIKKELKNIFDLENIDWNKIRQNVFKIDSNLLYVIESYKNGMSKKEMANELKVSQSMITKYLKIAEEINVLKNTTNKRAVDQYDMDDNYLNTFESISIAQKETKTNHIYSCCIGDRKSSGGYKWKFSNKYLREDNNEK